MHSDTAFDDADLNGFVDGRLEPSRAAALAAALDADPEASARMEAWRRQTDGLRAMFASVLAEPVPVRLLPTAVAGRAAAHGGSGKPAPAGADRPTPRRLAGVVATTAVGAALAGFALGALASLGTDGFGIAPPAPRPARAVPEGDGRDLATRAAEAHRTFIADTSRPVEFAAGEGRRLARWIGRRLGPGLRVPDLARQGWSLMGARIVPGRRGPAVLLAYSSGTDRLGLVVSRDVKGSSVGGSLGGSFGSSTSAVASDDAAAPIGVATWTDGEFGYAFTSDRGRDWLARNLAPLREAVRETVRTQARAEDDEAP